MVPYSLSKLTIDKNSIVYNYTHIKDFLYKGVSIACVLKADAYGLGATNVGRILYDAGCRIFFVATVQEGILLRRAIGFSSEIYVLCGVFHNTEDLYIEYSLTPTINNVEEMLMWHKNYAKYRCILKIDTGMSRNGLSIIDVMGNEKTIKELNIVYVVSHLACADDPDNQKNVEQLNRFMSVKNTLGDGIKYSLSATNGVFLGKQYHFDMVRIGAGLYNFVGDKYGFRDVVGLYARILQIKNISKGSTVGYDDTFIADNDMMLAVIGIGYADGLMKLHAGKYTAYVGDYECPFVGEISMDYSIIDVTHVPRGILHVEDFVSIFGHRTSIKSLAGKIGTNCGHITSILGRRVERVYY